MSRSNVVGDREERKIARSHLRHEWFALYLLPVEDKTPDIRQRMNMISNKLRNGDKTLTHKEIVKIAKLIAEEITSHEDEVFPYIGIGYVLDQNRLLEHIIAGLQKS